MEESNTTSLKNHKQNKKILKPPLSTLNIHKPSWSNERLPEMLWAVLVIGNCEREKALDFFRYVAKFTFRSKAYKDITLSGISKLSTEKKEGLIAHMSNYDAEISNILSSLLLFKKLPSKKRWAKYFSHNPNSSDEKFQYLVNGVQKTLFHQTQEATDCRWIRYIVYIHGSKLKFTRAMEHNLDEIIGYPEVGDQRSVRPLIRSGEMMIDMMEESKEAAKKKVWAENFWDECYKSSSCVTESETYPPSYPKDWEAKRNFYIEQTKNTRAVLLEHAINTAKTSGIDLKHEAVFGIALYSLNLLIELIMHRLNHSVVSRMVLRSLTECCITISYLIDKNLDELYASYRAYGIGQAKLAYLKIEEIDLANQPKGFDKEQVKHIINEDEWQEFVNINIGQWDSIDLRKMSEDCETKDIYDKYYSWTSGNIHGNWASVREVVYENCLNPTHRIHRVPRVPLPILPDPTEDAVMLVNKVIEKLEIIYPNRKRSKIKIYSTST